MKSKAKVAAVIIASIFAISMFYVTTPIALAYTQPSATNYSKVSPTLLGMMQTKGSMPVDVLVTSAIGEYASIASDIEALGGQVRIQFKYVDALAATVPADKILALSENSNIEKIYYDAPRSLAGQIPQIPLLDPKPEVASAMLAEGYKTVTFDREMASRITPDNYWNPIAMGAEPVWSLGDMGQDSMVVVIDTGIWAGHFLFAGTEILGGVDLSPDVGTEYEGWSSPANYFHGTHVAGIIASTGGIIVPEDDLLVQSIELYTGTPLDSADGLGYPGYKTIWLLGMAPFASLYAIKVFPHGGEGVPESYVLAGMEYSLDLKLVQGYDVDVISMSLGGPTVFDGRDVEDQLVDYITSWGITLVAAAGNEGPAPMTTGSPGSANTAITVGAAATPVQTRVYWDQAYETLGIGYYLYTSETPQIYAFSSRGPTSDGRAKPTLAATGIMVMSAYHVAVDPQMIAWASGTSMATPAVSGAVALMNTYAEAFIPGATPTDYKQALEKGAVWLDGYSKYDQGAGFLNAYNSLVALDTDSSIGDVAAPLPPFGHLKNIANIPIFGAGRYETKIVDLAPGHKMEFIFRVTELTDSITLEISNVKLGEDLGLNSFEVYIGSAIRTAYAYYIDSANVWGDASFTVTDYKTTWSGDVSGVFTDPDTRLAPIQPGFVKIVIENDWTSFDKLSCKIKIKANWESFSCGHYKYYIKAGVLSDGQDTGWMKIPVPPKTIGAEIVLYWLRDWSFYPTSDLDMVVYADAAYNLNGAKMNSPERVILGETGLLYVLISGYSIPAGKEPYILVIRFTIGT